jgi:hypothetical protein
MAVTVQLRSGALLAFDIIRRLFVYLELGFLILAD